MDRRVNLVSSRFLRTGSDFWDYGPRNALVALPNVPLPRKRRLPPGSRSYLSLAWRLSVRILHQIESPGYHAAGGNRLRCADPVIRYASV